MTGSRKSPSRTKCSRNSVQSLRPVNGTRDYFITNTGRVLIQALIACPHLAAASCARCVRVGVRVYVEPGQGQTLSGLTWSVWSGQATGP